jgi:FkbM family methyltransferase
MTRDSQFAQVAADLDSPFVWFQPRSVLNPSDPFVSYAQNGEDVLLFRALHDVRHGFYIDVGAAEPEADSVTCAFYQRGWRGINIEPTRDAFERLQAGRPGDINLNLAVAEHNGSAPFYVVDDGAGLSTMMADQNKALRGQGWTAIETTVTTRTLTSVVAQHVTGSVHFLKIDAEGAERSVLASADLRLFRPWIILVEATAPNSRDPTFADWEGLLLEADYRFAWFDGLNRYYLAEEHAERATAFTAPPNVFDGFITYREWNATQTSHALTTRAEGAEAGLAQLTDAHIRAATALDSERQQRAHIAGLLAQVSSERDCWMQDHFEATRHATHLVQERQGLIERISRLEAEHGERIFDLEAEHSEGISRLEARYSAAVADLRTQVAHLEAKLERLRGPLLLVYNFFPPVVRRPVWSLTRHAVRIVFRVKGSR